MKRSEPIRIRAVHNFEHFIILVEILLCEGENLDDLRAVSLIDFGPIVHLYLFDVLLAIFLLLGLLVFA